MTKEAYTLPTATNQFLVVHDWQCILQFLSVGLQQSCENCFKSRLIQVLSKCPFHYTEYKKVR